MGVNVVFDIVLALLSAVVGAVLSMWLTTSRDRRKHGNPKNLSGRWFSSWKPIFFPEQDWVEEKIDISVTKNRVKGNNYRNTNGFYWEFDAE